MKELTIEEKAQAYDEAIKRAKELLEIGLKDTRGKRVVLSFFPELKESEDERIREELIELIGCMHDADSRKGAWLAWLEKQKSVEEIVAKCKTSWYNKGKIQGQIEGLSDEEKYWQGWHDALKEQGEQKPAKWSEEDEMIVLSIEQIMNRASFLSTPKQMNEIRTWLKSLKQRIGG